MAQMVLVEMDQMQRLLEKAALVDLILRRQHLEAAAMAIAARSESRSITDEHCTIPLKDAFKFKRRS